MRGGLLYMGVEVELTGDLGGTIVGLSGDQVGTLVEGCDSGGIR